MTRVVLTKGLPASGKSTWAKSVVDSSGANAKRVNKDDLRAMLDNGKHSSSRERFVLNVRDHIIKDCMSGNYNMVIVDDTNLDTKHERHIQDLIDVHNNQYGSNHTLEIQDFTHVPVDECIKRDAARPNPVGAKVIRTMYNRYLKPEPVVFPYDNTLFDSIICDLDGTLCHLNGRNPYDASTCGDDLLNETVSDILTKFNGRYITILVSGRSDKYREQTVAWLKKHNIKYGHLFMRQDGDNRKDAVVKQEILDTQIKGKYNIAFVLDDRDQVVQMWRANGITCLQVAEGDF